MTRKPPRPRAARRASERIARGLVRDRERLAALSPGGSAEQPIDVPSTAVIELRARATPCPQCAGELAIIEHTARVVDDTPLRAVHVRCRLCGVPRTLWYRLVEPPQPN